MSMTKMNLRHQINTAELYNLVREQTMYKGFVLCATTGDIALASTTTVLTAAKFDGMPVPLAEGSLVAVKDQTDKKQNGIYVVGSDDKLVRAFNADATAKILNNSIILVDAGSIYEGVLLRMSIDEPFTLGSSDIEIIPITGGSSITAGSGISIVGNEVSVQPDATNGELSGNPTINVAAEGASVNVDNLVATYYKRKYTDPTWTINGTNKDFVVLGHIQPDTEVVMLNGIEQKSDPAYYSVTTGVTHDTITFVDAPSEGDEVSVSYWRKY